MAQADERLRYRTSTGELQRRWDRVREEMRKAGTDALVIQGANNTSGGGGHFRWFTGISAGGATPQTVIFPVTGAMTIFSHGDFGGDMRLDPSNDANFGIGRRMTTPSFHAVSYTQALDAELVAAEVKRAGYRVVSMVAPFTMYYGFVHRLTELLEGIALADSTEGIDLLKAVKSAEDIEWIRQTAAMQDRIFKEVCDYARPGMKDYEIMAHSEKIATLLGSECGYFLGSSSPRGTPAAFRRKPMHGREIRAGDVMVWQAENSGPGGFFVHLCRYIVFGRAPEELVEGFDAAIRAQEYTAALLKPGVACSDVYAAYNEYMRKLGFPGEQRLHCHGQGYENVERPLIRHDETMVIAGAMNIGIHPIIKTKRAEATVCDNFLTCEDGSTERLHRTPQTIVEL